VSRQWKRWSLPQAAALHAGALVAWAAVAALCLLVGSTGVGVPNFQNPEVLWGRMEVVLLASLVGAGLAAAGVAYQAVLRNDLADPYLLGAASGATLGGMLWRFPTFTLLPGIGALGAQSASLMGALLAVAVVFLAGSRRGRLEPLALLLTGVIVSSVCAAVLALLVQLRPDLLAFSGGGATGALIGALQTSASREQVLLSCGLVGAGFVALTMLAGQLAVSRLSDAEAAGLGLSIQRLRWLALIAASVMVSAAVAVSGPIGFVGLIAPHLARMLVGPDPRRLLPLSAALGAGLLALSDAACRLLSQPGLLGTLLPVGAVTALLGGPMFVLLLMRGERGRE
jgi:iron complex transport system permease protein